MRKSSLLLLLILAVGNLLGQTDTTFWFAAPNISESHGDRPIYFRFATFDQAATVSIKLPASNVVITTLQIPANSLESYLVENVDLIETEAGNIQNNGIVIESTSPVSAYYEVLGPVSNNTDIYTLKGQYALGTEFIVPIQNLYPNQSAIEAYNTIQIVATEDNTTIQVFPTNDVLNHENQSSITITLNQGQTYSLQATETTIDGKLAGTRITSNKPIAVTNSDDSVLYGNHWDLIGDQMIPFEVAGTKYVLPVGHIAISSKNDLDLEINSITYSLNSSNNHSLTFFNDEPFFLESSDTVVINYIDAYYDVIGGEVGGAILPPIACSGSREVAFIRSSEQEFWLHLVYRTSSQDDFTLNNTALDISSNTIYQLDDNLSYVKIPFSDTEIEPNQSHRIKNTSAPFHLATVSGGVVTGFQVGYFSNFRNELEDTIYLCERYDEINELYDDLALYGDVNIDSLIITNEDTVLIQLRTEDEYCITVDTVQIIQSSNPEILIPDTIEVCSDKDSVIKIDEYKVIYNSFIEDKSYLIKDSIIDIYVENSAGCNTSKEVIVNFLDTVTFKFPTDTFLCSGTSISIPTNNNADITTANGVAFNQNLIISTDSTLLVEFENICGNKSQQITISEIALPIIDLEEDREICSNQNTQLSLPSIYNYLWTNGDSTSFIDLEKSDTYGVTATNQQGCTYYDEVKIVIKDIDSIGTLNNSKICENSSYQIDLPLNHDEYNWSDGSNDSNRTLDTGIYQVEVITYMNDSVCYRQQQSFEITQWGLEIPNVITPNGDDKNETFIIENITDNFDLKLNIYNRWGKEIYSNTKYDNLWGDQSLTSGVYYYYAEVLGFDCTQFKGHITVIK